MLCHQLEEQDGVIQPNLVTWFEVELNWNFIHLNDRLQIDIWTYKATIMIIWNHTEYGIHRDILYTVFYLSRYCSIYLDTVAWHNDPTMSFPHLREATVSRAVSPPCCPLGCSPHTHRGSRWAWHGSSQSTLCTCSLAYLLIPVHITSPEPNIRLLRSWNIHGDICLIKLQTLIVLCQTTGAGV